MRPTVGRLGWLAFPIGAVVLGLAGVTTHGWLAWPGIALLAAGIANGRTRWRAAVGVLAFSLLTRAIWLQWGVEMAERAFPTQPALATRVAAGFVVVETLPVLAALLLGVLAFGPGPRVRLWLPLGWAVGERLQTSWTNVATDWVFTQVEVGFVMRLLCHTGMWATTIVCLFVASSAGAAWVDRRGRVWAPAVISLGFMLLLPAPRTSGVAALENVGVLHLTSAIDVPALDAASDLELIVWPEDALAARLSVKEGPVEGVRLDEPLAGPATWHVAGATTLLLTKQQNSVLAVSPDGTVRAARAKRQLFPVFERPFLGLVRGEPMYTPGRRAPLLEVGGRRVIPLVCGELLTRELVAEGVAAGGELLTISADDWYQGGSELAWRQVLAHVRLRAVEYGVPVAYASLRGRAAIVAPDGEVLAQSARGAPSGVLSWSPATGPRDRQERGSEDVLVLVSEKSLFLRPACPAGRCRFRTLEDVSKALERGEALPTADTVIVAGHAAPPDYAGQTPEAMARSITAFAPELVVLDLCYGASEPLFSALAARSDALVVASPAFVRARGFHYEAPFWSGASLDARARGISRDPPGSLYVGRLDASELARTGEQLVALEQDALRTRVRRWNPTLVGASLKGGEVVFPMDRRRIGRPPSPSELRRLRAE